MMVLGGTPHTVDAVSPEVHACILFAFSVARIGKVTFCRHRSDPTYGVHIYIRLDNITPTDIVISCRVMPYIALKHDSLNAIPTRHLSEPEDTCHEVWGLGTLAYVNIHRRTTRLPTPPDTGAGK